jgi:carboxypeptidase Taq
MQPYLEKTLELCHQYAEFFPGYNHLADPLLNLYDPGLTVAEVRRIFDELRAQLLPLVRAITAQAEPDDSCLYQPFPGEQQVAFALEIAQQFGYDLKRGRQDYVPHPFTTPVSLSDVRITSRANDHHLGDGLFATLHEAGHGIHFQGFHSELEDTPLGISVGWPPVGLSSSVAESQSRLWENIVGRSRGLWEHYYPKLQALFSDQLGQVGLETFCRAINKVKPALIRAQADELTYNLHIMIRFDLEIALLEGHLAVRDLPDAWRERYQTDLGLVPPDDRDGVLQDVHWHFMMPGYFQSYTLGNILAAQFFDAAVQAHPEIPSEIEQGHFGTLHSWLKDNIYQHGAKYTGPELTGRLTGGPISIQPCLRYWRTKFGALYDLGG